MTNKDDIIGRTLQFCTPVFFCVLDRVYKENYGPEKAGTMNQIYPGLINLTFQ